jgi:hypothetical protein
MEIKPIKKKFDDIVDAVAKYNPEKKRTPQQRPKRKKKRLG